jgi:hypothetical protein
MWRKLDCELCKEVFPTTISFGNEVRDLIQITTPDCPYLVLEDLRSAGYMTRGLHVVSVKEDGFFKIGRSTDCEIYLSDVSISRFHANIHLHKGGFYIEDRDSRYGTLLKAHSRLMLVPGVSVSLQVKSVMFTLNLKRPFRLRRICCCFYRTESEDDGKRNDKDISDRLDGPRQLDTVTGELKLSLAENMRKDGFGEVAGTTMRKCDDEADILVPEYA